MNAEAQWQKASAPQGLSDHVAEVEKRAVRNGSYAMIATTAGRIVLEVGKTRDPTGTQSVRKGLMNALIGKLVATGKIDLDATMGDLGIDDVDPSLSEVEKQATVRHCLMARSGVYHKAAYEVAGTDTLRPARHSFRPGQHWFYNNWDFNVLDTLVNVASGLRTFEAFEEWIARPLGMNFAHSQSEYVVDPCSIHAAYPFVISARDLARFGQLYLSEGVWGESQIIPAEWIRVSTYDHSLVDEPYSKFNRAFGYLWWVHRPELLGGFRGFAALGGQGHGLFVLPEISTVIVHQNEGNSRQPRWSDTLPLLAETAGICEEIYSNT